MKVEQILALALGPLLTAAIAGLGVLLQEWRTQRRWENRERLILEHGLHEVSFIAQWSQAHATLADGDPERDHRVARALADLERAYLSVEEKLRAVQAERPERSDLVSFGRSLLLLGVRRRWARAVRVTYYLGLGWVAVSSVVMMTVDAGTGLAAQVLIAVLLTSVYALPVWGLHRLTRWLDRPAGSPVPGPSVAVAS
ncbi:hypothetical protein [Ornithinimicrobium cavernae]|uniref:hypothetical protein n=1 Tax=Ornithinimicrobium cavernae TaxID=2666047 RepID=UPI000D6896E4|nr:hypothetical protein [Ornithinimicrobium cavernae]